MAVNLVFAGDSTQAQEAIAKLEKKFQSLEAANQRLSGQKKHKADTDDWGKSLDGVIGKYASIGAGVGLVTGALRAVVGENSKLLAQLDEFASKNSQDKIKLQLQGSVSEKEYKELIPKIEKTLLETPSTDMHGAMKLQTQLASSGFNPQDVKSGAALKTMLELKAATNQFGEDADDPKELAHASSMMLKGAGVANPSADDIKKIGGSMVSLFEASDVQLPDFKQLAPKLGELTQFGMSVEESMGAFSSLADVMGGNKADTGLMQFVSRTSTAGAYPERKEALKSVGIEPGDIAMSPGGKNIMDVADFMREKLSKVDAVKKNEFLAKFYGEEAGPAASQLLSEEGSSRTRDYIKRAGDHDTIDRNVKTFQGSRFAENEREGVKGDVSLRKMDEAGGEYTWAERDKARNSKWLADMANAGEGVTAKKIGITLGNLVEQGEDQLNARMWGGSPKDRGWQRGKNSPNELSGLDQTLLKSIPIVGPSLHSVATAMYAGSEGKQPAGNVGNDAAIQKLTEALEANTRATLQAKPETQETTRPGRIPIRRGNTE